MNNKVVLFLLPLSLFFDILTDTVFEKGGFIVFIRAFLYYSVIIYSLVVGYKRKYRIHPVFLIFFLYVIAQVPFSSSPSDSLRISLKILMSIMMFPVGFYLIDSFQSLKVLNKSLVFTMCLYLLNYAVSQYLGIGTSIYTKGKELVMGNLDDTWNNITYMLLVLPVVLLTVKKRIMIYLLSAVLLILLVIGLKRIAILGVIVGYTIYIFRTGKAVKSIFFVGLFGSIFLVFLPVFQSTLVQRLEAREDKITNGSAVEIIQKEGRALETIAVLDNVIQLKEPFKVFFGGQAFYSVGNYAQGSFGERQLHVDYNLILNTIGVFGLLLYFWLFYTVYRMRKRVKKFRGKNRFMSEIDAVFLVLIITQFITSLGGQMYAFTFRSIIFLYLGSILGNMYKYSLSTRDVANKMNS